MDEDETSIIEPASFESAFFENFGAIHGFLSASVGTNLADDLAAETFAVAFRRRGAFDPSRGAVRGWLFGIAALLLREHWRAERQLAALEARLAEAHGSATLDNAEAALAASLAPTLTDALAHLPRTQRDVLLLHAWGELSCEEIADALGRRPATVRSQLSRARAQLRRALGELNPGTSEGGQSLLEGCET